MAYTNIKNQFLLKHFVFTSKGFISLAENKLLVCAHPSCTKNKIVQELNFIYPEAGGFIVHTSMNRKGNKYFRVSPIGFTASEFLEKSKLL